MPANSREMNNVAIVGCGNVGMTAAYSILHTGLVNKLYLVGRNMDSLIGEQLDLEHSLPFLHPAKIKATTNYADIADSDVVVITAGAAQKPGETRLDLTQKNLAIISDIIPKIVKYAPGAVILMVSNPVDILTYHAYRIAGLPKGRIFGSGTILDTARFRHHLSQFLNVNPRSIHAYILGEHGDSSFPVISSASVGGQNISTMPVFSEQKAYQAYQKARTAAYKIIESKGATYYAIGAVISSVIKAILQDQRTILPVSIPLHGYHGHHGVALSVPSVVGREGVSESLEIKLSWDEKQKLANSVKTVKSYL